MGVPYYFYKIYTAFNNITIPIESIPKNVEYLFFDYNSLIHPCAQVAIKTFSENGGKNNVESEIIKQTINYTRYIISLVKPRNIYIMIDGVAPMGKLHQQKERRYKSNFLNPNNLWDSNNITPGTPFMSNLTESLSREFPDVIISDSNEPGEGEHKMIRIISNLVNPESIMIYGLDGDLLMLSLLSKWSESIILIRDNSFNEKLAEVDKTFMFVDIKVLCECVYNESVNKIKSFGISKNEFIRDYIFLCFFLGNDFVEHIPSISIRDNGLAVVQKIYIKLLGKYNRSLTYPDIHGGFLTELVKEIGSCEDYYFDKIFKMSKLKEPLPEQELTKSIHFMQDNYIYGHRDFKSRYYLFYNVYNSSNLSEICKKYIESIYWTWGYYNGHKHDNWSWSYKFPVAPFASTLYNFLRTFDFKQINFKKDNPITPLEQLLIVLPPGSLVNINESYKRVFRVNSKTLHSKFPNKLLIDLHNREWIWQSKVLFNDNNESVNLLDYFSDV